MKNLLLAVLASCFLWACVSSEPIKKAKPRTIITTDGEIDDVDSFVRMLLYANEFKIEGLVYSSSMWHYKGDGKGTTFVSEMEMTKQIYPKPRTDLRWAGVNWIQDLLKAYAEVYPSLSKNGDGFPTAEELGALVKVGNIDFEGEMAVDTEGSNWIKEKLLDSDDSPIYLQAWGGTNTIARALKSIEEIYSGKENWKEIYKKVSEKAIIYTIMDQDATYKNYVAKAWPDIKVLYNSNQFFVLAYPWKSVMPKDLLKYFDGKFMGENIINDHGPLMKMYYSYGDGQKQLGDEEHIHGDPNKMTNAQWGSFVKYDFISEGDSPAFLHLIDVGLMNLDHPDYGGWGGRLVQSNTNPSRWEDGVAASEYNPQKDTLDLAYAQLRWLAAIQNDFAARADWCVKPFAECNHPPVVAAKAMTFRTAIAGETVNFGVDATDPDGDKMKIRFWEYREAGKNSSAVEVFYHEDLASVKIPETAKAGDTYHIICEVEDEGKPALTRYARWVFTVK